MSGDTELLIVEGDDGAADLHVDGMVITIPRSDLLEMADRFLVGWNTNRSVTVSLVEDEAISIHFQHADLENIARKFREIAGIEQA